MGVSELPLSVEGIGDVSVKNTFIHVKEIDELLINMSTKSDSLCSYRQLEMMKDAMVSSGIARAARKCRPGKKLRGRMARRKSEELLSLGLASTPEVNLEEEIGISSEPCFRKRPDTQDDASQQLCDALTTDTEFCLQRSHDADRNGTPPFQPASAAHEGAPLEEKQHTSSKEEKSSIFAFALGAFSVLIIMSVLWLAGFVTFHAYEDSVINRRDSYLHDLAAWKAELESGLAKHEQQIEELRRTLAYNQRLAPEPHANVISRREVSVDERSSKGAQFKQQPAPMPTSDLGFEYVEQTAYFDSGSLQSEQQLHSSSPSRSETDVSLQIESGSIAQTLRQRVSNIDLQGSAGFICAWLILVALCAWFQLHSITSARHLDKVASPVTEREV